ncbi:MAG: c-type cytochrome domain-containing protein, partial [Alphaproteobacteria bacterium]
MWTEPIPRPGPSRRLASCLVRSAPGLAVLVGLTYGIAAAVEPARGVDFDLEIRPLLADNCFQCHGPDQEARKAKLRLDRREGVLGQVSPGRPGDSPLFERVASS